MPVDGVLGSDLVTPGAAAVGQPDGMRGVTISEVSGDELTYWQDQAALLDPAAYVSYGGATINVTVPAGETWYALALWFVVSDTGYIFFRTPDVRAAVVLPPGTVIKGDGTQFAQAYICKPSLVTGGASYANPRALWFSRMAQLRTLAQLDLSVQIPAGSAEGTAATTNFPGGTGKIMVQAASCEDASWLALLSTTMGGLNVASEISDDHAQRFARPILLPVDTADVTAIKLRAGSTSGNATDTSLAGYGAIKYCQLPAGW